MKLYKRDRTHHCYIQLPPSDHAVNDLCNLLIYMSVNYILHITKSWCAESGPKAKGPPWCACFRCLWIAFCLLAMNNACLKELKDQRGNLFESHLYSTWQTSRRDPFITSPKSPVSLLYLFLTQSLFGPGNSTLNMAKWSLLGSMLMYVLRDAMLCLIVHFLLYAFF